MVMAVRVAVTVLAPMAAVGAVIVHRVVMIMVVMIMMLVGAVVVGVGHGPMSHRAAAGSIRAGRPTIASACRVISDRRADHWASRASEPASSIPSGA